MTTDQNPIDIATFAIAFFEGAHRKATQAMEGMTDDQLFPQPSPDPNLVGWLAWHMSRWKDQFAAGAVGEEQEWIIGGWPEKFGVAPERTGEGDSLEQVAAFRPAREVLLAYVDAAQASIVEHLGRVSPARLLEDAPATSKDAIRGPCGDRWSARSAIAGQHAGQMAYLRGLITGYGWRGF